MSNQPLQNKWCLCRQRDFLEKTVADLKSKLGQEVSNHARDYNKLLQENMQLVKEIAAMRGEVKSAQGNRIGAQARIRRGSPRASKDSIAAAAANNRSGPAGLGTALQRVCCACCQNAMLRT